MKTCPKCKAELTTCLCCNAKTLCRKCKACFGYKGMFRPPETPFKPLTGIVMAPGQLVPGKVLTQ